ncbi:DNA/RNA non-specific endonuclease [Aerococcaceae bacterium zg-ZUI334]|uniref:hypothetical protein n=1 Tax=Aerococcaceae bacterium zg-252 TaxID=2796928 RepID=UPI001B9B16F5|nr:DNA/RNA non-specific endonuclease [Aerococcaceae bacterium zg-ZUI334]
MEYKSKRGSFTVINEYSVEFKNGPIEPNVKAKEKPQNTIDSIMWQVILKKNPDPNYFDEVYERVNIPKQDGIDKGHFIPKQFMKYLIPNYRKDEDNTGFTHKYNGFNISNQSVVSNRGYKKIKGQLQYEQEIVEHFKRQETDVYYEIEEIKNEDDNVLGRRIFIHFYDSNEKNIHIFIPEKIER